MKTECEIVERKEKKFNIFGLLMKKKILLPIICVLIIIVGVGAVSIGLKKHTEHKAETLSVGLKDIGEIATQVAYCKEVSSIEDTRKLFKFDIPFTKSKQIFSYGVEIKAGYKCEDIKCSVKDKVITIKLPKAEILSCALDQNSFEIYHDEESIFSPVTLTELNDSMKNLEKTAEEGAVANGLLEQARKNVEVVLKGFVGGLYDLNEYELKFKDIN